MKTLQLEKQNVGKPTNPDIVINPKEWGSETQPQAYEKDGEWYYNYPAAMLECGDRLPTDEQWTELLEGKDIGEFIKENNIKFFGYCYGGSCGSRGVDAYYWSSTESASSAWRRFFNYSYDSVGRGTNAQTYAFSVRCLKDSFESYSIGLFEETINTLENMRVDKQIELEKITEAIKLLRKIK